MESPNGATPRVLMLTGDDLGHSGADGLRITGKMQRALFVALALNAGRHLSRDWIADLLWPDAGQSAARQRLRMTLLNLRRSLANDPALKIDGSAEELRLDISPADVDVLRLLACGIEADTESRMQAVSVYRGDLLERFPQVSEEFDAYLSTRRAEAQNHGLALLHSILRDSLASGDLDVFERALPAALTVGRGDDTTAELGMRFYANRGEPDQVDRVFSGYRTRLRSMLDADASEEMHALHDRLLAEARSARANAFPSEASEPEARPGLRATVPRMPWSGGAGTGIAALGLFAAVVLLAGGLFWWFYGSSASAPSGPVFLVRQAVAEDGSCASSQRSNEHVAELMGALESFEDGTIVIGRLRGALVRSRPNVFEVEHSIDCALSGIRSTITVVERETQDVILITRIDGEDASSERLRREIVEHLQVR